MEVFVHQLHSEERAGGDSAWFCFFCVCVWFMQPQAGDRVPGVGEQGVLWEQLSPECHPPAQRSPCTQDIRGCYSGCTRLLPNSRCWEHCSETPVSPGSCPPGEARLSPHQSPSSEHT